MNNLPPQVQIFINALSSIQGIKNVEVNLQPIDSIEVKHLTLPAEYALLPHLAIRRSNGGRNNEALVTFRFDLEKNQSGWVALEFLAWWIRDMCKAEEEIQLRPLAFPPATSSGISLGNSLSFLLELFLVEPNDDPLKIADYVGKSGEHLKFCLDMYSEALEYANQPN